MTALPKFLRSNQILVVLTILITTGVLVFNVFHYSAAYGIVEINNVNSLFLVPFIALVCLLGINLGTTRRRIEMDHAVKNRLTDREKEVIKLIFEGKKNKQICEELFVELSTVKSHLNNIYKKTGAKNRKELIILGDSVLEKV